MSKTVGNHSLSETHMYPHTKKCPSHFLTQVKSLQHYEKHRVHWRTLL